MRALDHLIWAVPDLEAGIAMIEALSGVRPQPGGTHPGRGTRNALLSLGASTYLEILAPDPGQDLAGTFGAQFLGMTEPRLLGAMIASDALEDAKAIYAAAGVDCDGPFAAERRSPDGRQLRWRLLIPRSPPWGEATPMVIDWGATPSPASTAPRGCSIQRYELGHPAGDGLQAVVAALESDIAVFRSDRAYRLAHLSGPKGPFSLVGL